MMTPKVSGGHSALFAASLRVFTSKADQITRSMSSSSLAISTTAPQRDTDKGALVLHSPPAGETGRHLGFFSFMFQALRFLVFVRATKVVCDL